MRVGQVSNEMFGFLCRLEHFDLSGNPGLDQSTLAGYLACTQKNIKDATRIDARDRGLKGEGLSTRTERFMLSEVCWLIVPRARPHPKSQKSLPT